MMLSAVLPDSPVLFSEVILENACSPQEVAI